MDGHEGIVTEAGFDAVASGLLPTETPGAWLRPKIVESFVTPVRHLCWPLESARQLAGLCESAMDE